MSTADAVEQARSVYGGWLLLRGDAVGKVAAGRYLAQAALLGRAESRGAHAVGGVVDMLHAASMYAVAAVYPSRRRASLSAALAATAFACSEFAVAARSAG